MRLGWWSLFFSRRALSRAIEHSIGESESRQRALFRERLSQNTSTVDWFSMLLARRSRLRSVELRRSEEATAEAPMSSNVLNDKSILVNVSLRESADDRITRE